MIVLGECEERQDQSCHESYDGKVSKVVNGVDPEKVLCNQLLPIVRRPSLDTIERLPECHLAQDVKREHLIPVSHIESFFCRSSRGIHSIDELIYASLDDAFLL